MSERTRGLSSAAAHAERFLQALDERPVAARATPRRSARCSAARCPSEGEDPEAVIDALAAGADAGIVASAGPRHFGFVIGGALPAALAADWLVSAWDQCAAFHSLSPAAAAIEEIAAEWTLDLLGLPASASVGFVTGGAGREHHRPGRRPPCRARARRLGRGARRSHRRAARERRLRRAGPRDDLHRAAAARPRRARRATRIRADDQGRMRPRGAAGGAGRPRRADDRLRAGGQRGHRRLRRLRADRRRLCRPRRLAARGRRLRTVGGGGAVHPRRCCAASSAPTRGRSTRTSGSTSPTTARWPSSPTPTPIAPR